MAQFHHIFARCIPSQDIVEIESSSSGYRARSTGHDTYICTSYKDAVEDVLDAHDNVIQAHSIINAKTKHIQ